MITPGVYSFDFSNSQWNSIKFVKTDFNFNIIVKKISNRQVWIPWIQVELSDSYPYLLKLLNTNLGTVNHLCWI